MEEKFSGISFQAQFKLKSMLHLITKYDCKSQLNHNHTFVQLYTLGSGSMFNFMCNYSLFTTNTRDWMPSRVTHIYADTHRITYVCR